MSTKNITQDTTKTIDEFISEMKKVYNPTESEIREAVDSLSFWVRPTTRREQFIVHCYLTFLSKKFSFEIDTNVDTR